MTPRPLSHIQLEIDRLIETCRKNNWPVPRTCGALIIDYQAAEKLVKDLRHMIAFRSEGKRMREDGVYF